MNPPALAPHRRTLTAARLAQSAGLVRTVFAASLVAGLALPALARGPEGAQVVRGSASIQSSGVNTIIRAGNNSIINFRSFNIGRGESVRFIQPSSSSRVLNRITGADPSRIAGTLTANGIVYIVNPAGVYFAHGSLVDVGGIYAAAGNITNTDFINNVNHFSGVRGAVENRGTINSPAAHLVGARVANYGTINAPGGIVTMSAGGEVYLGEPGGQVLAHVSGGATGGGGTGVTQAGQVNAAGGRVRLGAGDMYAMAIDHPGRTTARDIKLQGGRAGVVSVSGTLDASNRAPGGVGGTVQVLGDRVGLFGGQVDASGAAGGGTVLLGGDYQGHGPTQRASATYVSEDATVRADAVTSGNGGRVIVWSDFFTNYQGHISARGGAHGGSGGFVETSGKANLLMVGSVDASAPHGRGGLWLLDPTDVTISTAATAGGSYGAGVFTPDPVATANVNTTDIETSLQGGTSVVINTASAGAGTGDITILDPLNPNMAGGDATLTLNAVNDIIMTNGAASIAQSGAGDLSLQFNAGNAINITRPITVDGSVTLVGPAGISLGADLSAGLDITFSGPLTLTADLTLTGNDITFSSTVDSDGTARSLTLDTTGGGVTSFGGNVGDTSALATLTTNGDGSTIINAAEVHGVAVAFNDAVTIGVDAAITGTTSVLFASTVDSEAAEANDLTVDSPLTTFTGNVGAGAGGDLGALATDAPGTTTVSGTLTAASVLLADDVTLAGGSVTTTGDQSYGDLMLAADTVLSGNNVTFNGTVDSSGGARNLTVDSSGGGVTTFGGDVGAGSALATLTTNGDGSTIINAAEVHGVAVAFNDAVTIGVDAAITGTTSVLFASTVDSEAAEANDLTVDSPLTTFTGNVGAGADGDLGALSTDAPGTTTVSGTVTAASVLLADDVTLGGGSVTTTGDQSYGDLMLAADTVLSGNNVTFNGTVDSSGGARNLTVDSSGVGVTIFNGAVGAGSALATLTTNADGLTRINAAQVNAAAMAFNDPVRIDVDTTLTGTTSIAFAGTVDSQLNEANDLTLDTPLLAFGGNTGNAVGGAFGTLTTDAPGTTTINAAQVRGAVLDFNDDVVIGADTTLTATTSADFAQTLVSESGEANDLTINSPSLVFNDLVGSGAGAAFGLLRTGTGGTTLIDTTAITGARLDFGNAVVAGQDLTLTGTQSIVFRSTLNSQATEANDLTLNSPVTNFNGQVGNAAANTAFGAFLTDAPGTTTMNAGVLKAATVEFRDAVVLAFNLAITAPTSVTFGAELDSRSGENRNLTVNSPSTLFAGVVGGSSGGALGTLTTDAAGTTTIDAGSLAAGTMAFNDAVVLARDSVLTGTGAVTFSAALNSQSGEANDLTITAPVITFSAAVGGGAGGELGSLIATSTGSIHLDGGQVRAASADFRGNTVLGASTTVTVTSSARFGGTLDSEATEANALTVIGSSAIFTDDVGSAANGALGFLTVDGVATIGTNATTTEVTTTGDQIYNAAVRLAGAATLTGANVTFLSTVDSALADVALVVNTTGSGLTLFTGAVGSITPLASLTTNLDGSTRIAGGSIITSGDQAYNDRVVLTANTTLSGNNVLFGDTLDSDATFRALTVTATGGGVTFASAVGSISRLASLAASSATSTRINGGSLVTEGAQNYSGAAILGADTTLTGSGVTFGDTLNSDNTFRSLTIDTTSGGTTTFNGDVGGSSALRALTTNADGRTQIFGNAVRTINDQQYNDAVVLGGDVTIQAQNARFGSTIDATPLFGPVALIVNASATTTFTGAVGAGTPLTSLTTDAQGTTRIGADITTTGGTMAFNDAVTVFGDATLTDTGGTGITFGSTLNSESGSHALALMINTASQATQTNPQIAKISFGGNVGSTLAFSSLTLGGDRSFSPAVATIVAGLNPITGQPIANFAMTITTTGAFTMGAAQKFTVVGDLTINSGGTATLSDISTLRNLTVNAPAIAIHTRPGGPVLGAIVGTSSTLLVTDSDLGTDFVAGGNIDFSQTPTILGGFAAPSFATPSAGGISAELQGFAQRAFGDLDAGIMHAGLTYLDLRSAGPSNANFAEAIAGAAPRESQSGLVTQDTAVGRAQQEELEQLGIFARSPEAQQLLDFLTGRALYMDVPNKPNPVASDYQVTVNRLPAELVAQVLASYRAVFYKDGQPAPQRPAEVLQKAWEEYAKAAGDKADALGFRAYVESVPEQAEALYYLDGLRQLFIELGYLGLSPVELKIARQTLLQAVAFPGLSPEQLESAIMARNLGSASAD